MKKETKKDSKEMFLESYDAYADTLFRFALFKTSDRETSLDLVQEAFSNTWRYIYRGGDILNMKAFLYRTLNNLVIDHYRSNRPQSSLETMLEEDGFEPPADDEHVADYIDGDIAVKMVSLLPKEYRDVIYLRYIEGLSVLETAKSLGISRTLAGVRIHRGIAKLRNLYKRGGK